jgi:hypothetical protein
MGLGYISLCVGIKNIVIGLIHGLLSTTEELCLFVLLSAEIMSLVATICLLSKSEFFDLKFKVWINQFTTFIRILLIFCFSLDYPLNGILYSIYEFPYLVFVCLFIMLYLVGIATESVSLLK